MVRIGIMKAKIIDFKNFQLKLLQSNSLTKKKKKIVIIIMLSYSIFLNMEFINNLDSS